MQGTGRAKEGRVATLDNQPQVEGAGEGDDGTCAVDEQAVLLFSLLPQLVEAYADLQRKAAEGSEFCGSLDLSFRGLAGVSVADG